MNVICLVIDRLNLAYLGAFGNAWIETPGFDRFAGEAFLFDQAILDSPRLDLLYRSLWFGRHAMSPDPGGRRRSLANRLSERGVRAFLLTDDPTVAGHEAADGFFQRGLLDPPVPGPLAASIEDTYLATGFSTFLERLDGVEADGAPFLAWGHFGCLGTVWDAPFELRSRYVEEGDPLPTESAIVPCRRLPPDCDPDELVAVSHAYAGQILTWDACFEAFLEHLNDTRLAENTLVIVFGARGFPLGEHGHVGDSSTGLFSPLVHVPLAIRVPGEAALARSQAIVEPADLFETVLDAFGIRKSVRSVSGHSLLPLARGEIHAIRDRAGVFGGGSEHAIRTAAWYLRLAEPTADLFAKPDDFWDANNVADRCHDVVDRLKQAFCEYRSGLAGGRLDNLTPLAADLTGS